MKQAMPQLSGNHALKARLCRDILASSLAHALILEGPKGTGKHTLAHLCAAALVCEHKEDSHTDLPCGACISCRKVLEGKSPDLITVGREDKATIGVDSIRFLREDVRILPNDSDHKVYIIEDADRMTEHAQNALLLTLEEPPAFVHFFLLCENANLLLETIRSRAPILRTEPLTMDEVDRYLAANDPRAAQMKLASPEEYAELLIACRNGIGRAMELLEPKVFAPIRENRALVAEFTEAAIGHKGAAQILPLLSRFSTKRESLRDQLALLSDAIRDLVLLKKSEQAPLIFYGDRMKAIELCDAASMGFLLTMEQSVQRASEENARNGNVRLLLTKLVTSMELL
ncbi:MAG: hypothetical protein IJY42_03885 [Clostridia bacterium]|nr:hypothetical protein [Clostridia bacterium]